MELPRIVLETASTITPSQPLKAIVLAAPAIVPPRVVFGALIATLLSGLTFVAMRACDRRQHLVAWALAAAVFVLASVAWIFWYRTLSDEYLATYQGAPVVIGGTLTDVGAAWVADHGNESPSQLLFDAHGDVSLFWTKDGVARAYLLLRVTYYGAFAREELAGKLDMIPGRKNILTLKAKEPGISRGQCAEYCGGAHALMSFYVVVLPEPEFEQWLAREASPAPTPTSC